MKNNGLDNANSPADEGDGDGNGAFSGKKEFTLLVVIILVLASCYLIGNVEDEKEIPVTNVNCTTLNQCNTGGNNKQVSAALEQSSTPIIATHCYTQTSECRMRVAVPQGASCYCQSGKSQVLGVAR